MLRIDVICDGENVKDADTGLVICESDMWKGEGTLHVSCKKKRYYDTIGKADISVGVLFPEGDGYLYIAYTPRGQRFKTPKRIPVWND